MKTKKQGISLIVLVITIIVMIILAAAIILSLSSNGIIDRANEAVEKTDKAQVQILANTIWMDAYLDGNRTASALRTEVVKGLKNKGITADDYVVFNNGNGVEIIPTNSWDQMYTYSETLGWSSKITKEDEIEDENPTIIARFYKTGRKITLSEDTSGDMATLFGEEQDEYKMIIFGTGNMGDLTNSESNVGYAWQEDTFRFDAQEEVIPVALFTTEIIIEEGITNISYGAFIPFMHLENITIANSVLNIDTAALGGLGNMTRIVLPDGLKTVEPANFADCPNLKEIVVPSSITKFCGWFDEYNHNVTINYRGTEEQWKAVDNRIIGEDKVTINYNYKGE